MTKKKVCFFTAAFSGGIGRALVNLISHIDRRRFLTQLILLHEKRQYLGDVPEGVPIYNLHKRHVRHTLLPLARLLHHIRPDLLFSTQGHANILALLANQLSFSPARTIISVRTTPSVAHGADPKMKNRIVIPFLIRQLYPRADCIHAVSRGAAEDTQEIASIAKDRIKVIYNPIVDERMQSLSEEQVHHPWFSSPSPIIVSVGRLSPEKGYTYLLQAVARVLQERPVKLVMVGEGRQREELETLARKIDIVHDVAFLGYQENPYKYMARADVFVLSSLWEGLANVVIEAMACGAPVVATDCPSGPGEIITKSEEGLLVLPANAEALANAILRVLSDARLRHTMRVAGRARAQDFHVDRITREYEQLFLRVLEGD